MPSKNKPKRLDRNTAWRVQRRKKKIQLRVKGNSRNRQPRPKHKGIIAAVVEKVTTKKAPKEVTSDEAKKAPAKEKAPKATEAKKK
jgi:hypothetical protein